MLKKVLGFTAAALLLAGCSDLATTSDEFVAGESSRAASAPNHYVKIAAASTSNWEQQSKFQFKITGLNIQVNDPISFTVQAPSGATSLTVRGVNPEIKYLSNYKVSGGTWYNISTTATSADSELGITFYTSNSKTSGAVIIGDLKIGSKWISAADVKNTTKPYFSSPASLSFSGSNTGSSDSGDNPGAPDPNPPVPGNLPVMGNKKDVISYKVYYKDSNGKERSVEELSGLTLSKDKKSLIGNIDGGYLYELPFEGKDKKIVGKQIGNSSGYKYKNSEGKEKYLDMEGLAMNPATGDIYVCGEPGYFFKLSYSSYTLTNPIDRSKVLKQVKDAADFDNAGIEGIAWHNGNLYLGSQTDAKIWEYTTDGKQVGNVKKLKSVTSHISEVADLEYDPDNDWLWVLDSNDNREKNKKKGTDYYSFTIYLFNGDATKLLQTYYIGDFANGNPEALCVDKAHGCIWIGEDDDPSILHKIPFSNLK